MNNKNTNPLEKTYNSIYVESLIPRSIEELAQRSDIALDNKYKYGRSTAGKNFGWLANIESARSAFEIIKNGSRDIEEISDAVHNGWNKTAMADYEGKLELDNPTPEEKKQKRFSLAQKTYAQLPEEEKEKDRVVARTILDALTNPNSN
jgi:hypothetical protein